MLLIITAAMPCVAVVGGAAARTVAGVREDATPEPSATPASPSDTQPVPKPSATPTDGTDPPPPPDPVLGPPGEQVLPGETFTAVGSDFDCSAGDGSAGPLTFTVEGQAPVTVSVGDGGGFQQPVSVPTDAAPGRYGMTAVCAAVAGAPTAAAAFEVLEAARPDPRISLSSASGPPDEHLTVRGTGFVCGAGAGVDVLWDGRAVAGGTPSESGSVTIPLHVPSGASEGAHEVTAACRTPADVRASASFSVDPPDETEPTDDPREVTIHMADYPAACAKGSIVIGGRRLDTWLDADSVEGGAAKGHWELIDLHALIPTDMTGRRDVGVKCAGRAWEKAGVITLPPPIQLSVFQLPVGSTRFPEGETGPIKPSPSKDPTRDPTGGSQTPGGGDGGQDPDDKEASTAQPDDEEGDGGGAKRPPSDDPDLGLVGALRTPADVSWALKDLAGSVGMAAWFLVVVLLLERAFPSQLADNALGRWWLRRQARRRSRPPRLPGWARVCGFALLGGSLAVWADTRTGLSSTTAIKTAGAAAGMLVILVAYEKTKDSLLSPRRSGFRSELRVVPAGLVLAGLMTAMSRFLEFPVPYVYGLVAVYMVLRSPRRGSGDPDGGLPKGQAVLIGGICVVAAVVLLWVLGAPLLEAVRTEHAQPGSLRYALAYAVGLTVVAGIEVVVFGLLPLSGMDGHSLKDWNKPAWYALYLVGLTFFFHVLLHSLHPGVGSDLVVDGDLRWWTLGMATVLFLVFGAVSLVLRWYAGRVERRPQTA
ncbi:FGLLP motif-containing membrane protein [Streptomyces sp. NRRL B-1347]|uniref:FGLLP motif-containing membrane protein n=1 Tax=Streptomyces sp. NRRL B-1347 TaxID=1476877 RepID=UPI0004C7C7F3|nr:FGLLP motif-containing membrane protein [Streptomyces sp. NRRL B-1347]